jgi:hypothetical protein
MTANFGIGSRTFFIVAQQGKAHMLLPQPEFRVHPYQVVCGGTHCWFIDIAGTVIELGCVCHHDPNTELLRIVRAGAAIDGTVNS